MMTDSSKLLPILIPILVLLPFLYFRMRKLSRPQPLKLGRLWIRPAFILAATALVLTESPIPPASWPWLALAALLGAAGGWQWGRTMAIEVHPEDGTLMTKGGQAAILVLVVLILLRTGMRAGVAVEGKAWHLDVPLLTDASIVFSALLFTVRSLEMYLRAKRVMQQKPD